MYYQFDAWSELTIESEMEALIASPPLFLNGYSGPALSARIAQMEHESARYDELSDMASEQFSGIKAHIRRLDRIEPPRR